MTHHRQVRPKGPWTDEAILRESERWVHVPPSGVRVEDAAHLLVHPGDWRGTSRVWRSWPDRAGAEALIPQTIEETRAVGGTGLVWHTGDAVPPPFMDDALAQHGFEKTEDLDALAFELGADPDPNLPVPHDVSTRLVRDEDDLRLAKVVEAGVFPASTRGEADTRAYLRGLSELDAHRQRRPDADGVPYALRYLALVCSRGEVQEIAGTAGAELAGETIRLWGAGTLPGHRGRGAYRALVMERCRLAHALGATLALTKANTTTSAPILRNAGSSAPSPANAATPSRSPRRPARWGNAQAPPLTDLNLYLHFIHCGTNFRVLVQTQHLVPDGRLSRTCRAWRPVLRSFPLK